jgi:hypothetical protein
MGSIFLDNRKFVSHFLSRVTLDNLILRKIKLSHERGNNNAHQFPARIGMHICYTVRMTDTEIGRTSWLWRIGTVVRCRFFILGTRIDE